MRSWLSLIHISRWVRVVDYKTGTKKLDLKEVYCGLDCQMLLYLFSPVSYTHLMPSYTCPNTVSV